MVWLRLFTFDGSLYINKVVGTNILCWWALNNLEIAQSSKLNCEILECLSCLVDE
jgi:hypothetical protein